MARVTTLRQEILHPGTLFPVEVGLDEALAVNVDFHVKERGGSGLKIVVGGELYQPVLAVEMIDEISKSRNFCRRH